MKSNDKVVLLTGANRGIGLATVRCLSQAGYLVYGTVRKTSKTDSLDKIVAESDGRVRKIVADVTDNDSIQWAVNQIKQESGRLDILINNACDVVIGTVESCSLEQQIHSMDVNYFGAVRTIQAALPHMRQQESGHIVNMSSIAGFDPYPPIETYSATKFALEGLSESMATNLSPWNIRVSLVEPGGVKTLAPETANLGQRELEGRPYQKYCQESQKKMVESYKSGAQEPEEIAKLILKIVEDPSPCLRYQVGDFAKLLAHDRFKDPSGDAPVEAKREMLTAMELLQLVDTQ